MINTPNRIILFNYAKGSPDDGQKWLQIISITSIGDIGTPIKQKIIRLNEEDTLKLFNFLKENIKNEL